MIKLIIMPKFQRLQTPQQSPLKELIISAASHTIHCQYTQQLLKSVPTWQHSSQTAVRPLTGGSAAHLTFTNTLLYTSLEWV